MPEPAPEPQLSPRMEIIRLHVERVAVELKIKLLRERILKASDTPPAKNKQ